MCRGKSMCKGIEVEGDGGIESSSIWMEDRV